MGRDVGSLQGAPRTQLAPGPWDPRSRQLSAAPTPSSTPPLAFAALHGFGFVFFFHASVAMSCGLLFFLFFVGSKRHRVPVGGGTSTSPGVPGGASRASGAFASFPSLTLSRTGNLKRPCRVGRNQSYLLPSLLAAAVNSATEEKVKHFCFPSDPSLSAVPRHVSRCPPDLSQLSASALGAVFSSGPARVSPQGKVGSAAAPKRHRGRRRCRPHPGVSRAAPHASAVLDRGPKPREKKTPEPVDGRRNPGWRKLTPPYPMTFFQESLAAQEATQQPCQVSRSPHAGQPSPCREQLRCAQAHSKEPFLSCQLLPQSLLGYDV